MDEAERSEAVELVMRIRDARQHLLDQVAGLTDDALRIRPDAEEWSIIEVLAHLPDVDRHWLGQALAIRDNPDHLFTHFDDDRWKREYPDVRGAPLPAVFEAMQAAHDAVLASLGELSDVDLSRTGRHPRGMPYTVRDVILRYPAHDENHANQVAGIRRQIDR